MEAHKLKLVSIKLLDELLWFKPAIELLFLHITNHKSCNSMEAHKLKLVPIKLLDDHSGSNQPLKCEKIIFFHLISSLKSR